MTKRPRMRDELFELLSREKDSPNDSIDDVLLDRFPELEEELEKEFDSDLVEEDESGLFS